MNTSIHLPDDIACRLEKYISSPNCDVKSKNAFIVKAVGRLLAEVESGENWCSEIMAWQGGDITIEREEFTGFGVDLEL